MQTAGTTSARRVIDMDGWFPLPPKKDQGVIERLNSLEKQVAHLLQTKSSQLEPIEPTVENIKKLICQIFVLSKEDLHSKRTCHHIAWPRQIAFYLCKKYTDHSDSNLARLFCRRFHGTISYGYRRVSLKRETDERFRADMLAIEARFK